MNSKPLWNFHRKGPYLDHLVNELDNLTDCSKFWVVAWAQVRHDHQGQLVVEWVGEDREDWYGVARFVFHG